MKKYEPTLNRWRSHYLPSFKRGECVVSALKAYGLFIVNNSKHLTLVFIAGSLPWISSGWADSALVKGYQEAVSEIRYLCRADQSQQPALFLEGSKSRDVPLIVALHSWSGDYTQTSSRPVAEWCINKGWAFIHPDFRGANRNPEACGSDLAVRDVIDAVHYAKERCRIDDDRVYLVGASGGGHMALLMAGRKPELWAGVSAWVPISDLAAWYWEVKEAGLRYADEIINVCGSKPGSGAEADFEYLHRSPLSYLHRASGVALDINAGIRDGHDGSVPIRHSLLAYNSVVDAPSRIPLSQIEDLVLYAEKSTYLTASISDLVYGDKKPVFRRESGKRRVTLFDGGHEIVYPAALAWLEQQHR